MTYDEAVKISGIIEHADGGCFYCVSDLLEGLMGAFPDVDWENAFVQGVTGDHYWDPVEVVAKYRAADR